MTEVGIIDPWAALEALSQPVVVVDNAAQIRYRNPAARPEVPNPMADEDVGRVLRDVVARRMVSASIECAVGAQWFNVKVRAAPVDGRDGAIVEYRDITSPKAADAALREVEERFRTLVDGSPDIVFITDASSRMIYANAALEEQTGYTVADFQMAQADNRLIHPDDQEPVAAFLGAFLASGRKYSEPLRNRFIARDGTVLWFSSVVSRSEYAGEPVLQFVVHNVTEQERARDDVARMQERVVKQERLAALGELAAVVAHEIRNPVSIIYNALTTLRKEPPEQDAATLLRIVEEEARRLQGTVRDLLDFTRPMTPTFEAQDLALITREALAKVVGEHHDDTGIRIAEAVSAPCVLDVDRPMIHRAIVNLIANAFQAMPRGGDLAIDLRRDEATGVVELTIQDSGPGIATDAAAHIFEPFFTTKATGTGLGLALVKRIIDLHRGTIVARTGAAGGASFVVTLPTAHRPS